MRIDELHKPKEISSLKKNPTIYDVKTMLEKYGFQQIGNGLYARVFEHKKYPYILKVFDSNDIGYQEWFKFCKSNQNNPFIPKIRGKLIKLGIKLYACRLERLDLFVDILNPLSKFFWYIFEYTDEFKNFYMTKEFLGQNKHVDNILNHFDYYRKNHGMLDMHVDNIMLRNNQLVIIDPYG